MYCFILLPKYIYLIENMYLYIHTCIYYTCDMIPPPPQIPTYFLYVVYMTTSVKFFMNLWHIFLTFYDKITPVNLCIHDTCHKDSIVQIYLHEVKNWSCSILKKKHQIFISTVYILTYFSFCMVQNQNFKNMKNRKL